MGGDQLVSIRVLPQVAQRAAHARGLGRESSRFPSADGLSGNVAHRHRRVVHQDGDGLHRDGGAVAHMRGGRHRVGGVHGRRHRYRCIRIVLDGFLTIGRSPRVGHVLATTGQGVGVRAGCVVRGGQCGGIAVTDGLADRVGGDFIEHHRRVVYRHRDRSTLVGITGNAISGCNRRHGCHRVSLLVNSRRCRSRRIGRHLVACRGVQARGRNPSVGYRAIRVMLRRYGQRGAVAALTDGRVAREGRGLHRGVQHRDRHILLVGGGTGVCSLTHRVGGHHAVGGSGGDVILGKGRQGLANNWRSHRHLIHYFLGVPLPSYTVSFLIIVVGRGGRDAHLAVSSTNSKRGQVLQGDVRIIDLHRHRNRLHFRATGHTAHCVFHIHFQRVVCGCRGRHWVGQGNGLRRRERL